MSTRRLSVCMFERRSTSCVSAGRHLCLSRRKPSETPGSNHNIFSHKFNVWRKWIFSWQTFLFFHNSKKVDLDTFGFLSAEAKYFQSGNIQRPSWGKGLTRATEKDCMSTCVTKDWHLNFVGHEKELSEQYFKTIKSAQTNRGLLLHST